MSGILQTTAWGLAGWQCGLLAIQGRVARQFILCIDQVFPMCNQIRETVIGVIESETGCSLAGIDPDSDIRKQIDLDSMQYLAISVAVERSLNIKLPIEVMLARTFNDLLGIICEETEKNRETYPPEPLLTKR
jgi:acyl carrier protein